MLHRLAPNGAIALLLVNGSNSGGEGDIPRAPIKANLVGCTVRVSFKMSRYVLLRA